MRYLMTFIYDGTNYNGYQKQVNKNTIQDNIEMNLSKILNQNISISASGRTDAKVHALNQKAHFDIDKELELGKIKHSLNQLINDDIYIKDIINVDNDFHARFNVKSKEYVYKINTDEYNPLDRNYIYQYNKKLDLDKMKQASKNLIGTHNFKSFTKSDEIERDYERTIYDIKFEIVNNTLEITFIGSGFLRYMVRNIVGLLIEVGSNQRNIDEINQILESLDRTKAGITAPPQGLYLKNVNY